MNLNLLKKNSVKIVIILIVLFVSSVSILNLYNVFLENKEQSKIKGVVSESSQALVSFYLMDEMGDKTVIKEIPTGRNYEVFVDCNKGAIGSWNSETWGVVIKNLTEAMTKCNITFDSFKPLKKFGIYGSLVTSGNGIYEVNHKDAIIESPLSVIEKENLKQTEYRYAGSNPNNYVTFNNELWRMIGLVNTPEGQKIKLIRKDSIGSYSWDSSSSLINKGYGINEWSQADAMKLLNPGYEFESVGGSFYYNKQKGNCFANTINGYVACDFTSTGLSESAKKMISETTWNTGTNETTDYAYITPTQFYNYERSNYNGKICTSGVYCNDTVTRTISWKGMVGLTYISDYAYATSGTDVSDREFCLNKAIRYWHTAVDCISNDWLYNASVAQWTITSYAHTSFVHYVFPITTNGSIYGDDATDAMSLLPAIHLNPNVLIISGNGTQINPYILK